METYRYDALGNRVKKRWNYVAQDDKHQTGSISNIYGVNGEVLVEYKTENVQTVGQESLTTWNVYMGSEMMARRIQGTSTNGSMANKVEWLHRNHRQEIVMVQTWDRTALRSSSPLVV